MTTNIEGCCNSGKPASDSYVPLGDIRSVGGLQGYCSGQDPEKCRGFLFLLPDGFGLVQHNFILADDFAREGWYVLIPDYFEGDPLPLLVLKRNPKLAIEEHNWPEEDKQTLLNLNIPMWAQKHNEGRVWSLLTNFIAHISAQHPTQTKMVGVGYCFGGKYVLRLARGHVKAAAAFHPSFVAKDDMVEHEAAVYVGLAEHDEMVSPTLADDLQTWSMTSGDSGSFVLEIYPGMRHGFAARPDTKDDEIRAQYRKAFARTVEHFARMA